jgi:hypothetical protein
MIGRIIERTMKNERYESGIALSLCFVLMMECTSSRDGLRRPKAYSKDARKALHAARKGGEDLPLLSAPVIRYDKEGSAMLELYDVSHQSDNDSEEDEDEQAVAASRAQRDLAARAELSAYRKAQLEKEGAENQLLEVEDVNYYNVEGQVESLAALNLQAASQGNPATHENSLQSTSQTSSPNGAISGAGV